MSGLVRVFRSSVGAKALMALTGLGLLGFVVAHMLGNLQIFAGPEKLNAYAATLQHMGPGLWVARAGLLALLLVHVGTAHHLVRANRAARPVPYAGKKDIATTFAARTMWMTGIVVLAFVAYHLAHFTLHVMNPEFSQWQDAAQRHDVYRMVVEGFRVWWVSAIYCVAQFLLGVHISHGASSAFQTLGVRHPRLAFLKHGFGPLVAIVIVLGNLSIPLAVLAGLVGKQGV